MKIQPVSDNHVIIETDDGNFNVFSLVGGGLEITTSEHKMKISGCVSPSVIGARRVILEKDKR